MKKLRIEMPNGTVWEVPADIIARSRAEYYAKLDSERGEGEYNTLYQEEFYYSMSDDSELVDWAGNNMNWKEIQPYAKLTEKPAADYEKEWRNAELEIVEVENESA